MEGYNSTYAIVGSNITFSCRDDHILVGDRMIFCEENAKWQPDPSNTTCKGHDIFCTFTDYLQILELPRKMITLMTT